MAKHTCVWIIKVATWDPDTRSGTPMIRCDKPVGYTNPVHPDSGQRERKYNNFCDEHMAIAAAMPDDEDEGL